jgi:hypothetical protein
MKLYRIILAIVSILFFEACNSTDDCGKNCCKKEGVIAGQNVPPNMSAGTTSGELKCKLTSPELQKRKETVLEDLKNSILEKKELYNGYSFKFNGDDETMNKLIVFIQSERSCCDFFTFNLKVSGNKSALWLDITGSAEAKKFITDEMGLTANSQTSEITCPKCNTKKTEIMPTDVCQLAYTCSKCAYQMHPKNGDCCVFCTYGDHKCPSKQ